MFLSSQRKDRLVTMEKLLLLIDSKNKAELTENFCAHFFFRVLILAKYEFCAYLACIYFRERRLKENFACIWFCEIDQNSRNSQKYIHAKIIMLKVI